MSRDAKLLSSEQAEKLQTPTSYLEVVLPAKSTVEGRGYENIYILI